MQNSRRQTANSRSTLDWLSMRTNFITRRKPAPATIPTKSELPSWIYTATISHKLIKALSPFHRYNRGGVRGIHFPFLPHAHNIYREHRRSSSEWGKRKIQHPEECIQPITNNYIIWRGCIECAPRCKSLFLLTSVSLSLALDINESHLNRNKTESGPNIRARTQWVKRLHHRPELIKLCAPLI